MPWCSFWCTSRSFIFAQNELYKKAMKACSKLQREVTPNVKILRITFIYSTIPLFVFFSSMVVKLWGKGGTPFSPLSSKFKKIRYCYAKGSTNWDLQHCRINIAKLNRCVKKVNKFAILGLLKEVCIKYYRVIELIFVNIGTSWL